MFLLFRTIYYSKSGFFITISIPTLPDQDSRPPMIKKIRFPMWKFHALAQQLYDDQLVEEAELLRPWEVPRDMVLLAHDEVQGAGRALKVV